jgi:4-amino-4-deoxy-L-arabinose transferase-like glycosyltransferase
VSAISAEVSSRRLLRGSAAVTIVTLAAVLPRLFVVEHERGTILTAFVEKSDRFALTLVKSGTFGFLPGRPSAYTQPLYGWFLAGLYWPFGHSWLAVGLAQTVVAVLTALLVLAIGTRLASVGVGTVAALITTLHPYVVWHDAHVNREVLDGLVLALLALLALLTYEERTVAAAGLTGVVAGVAILGNARLTLLPLVLAPYVAWRMRPLGRAVGAGLVLVLCAALTVTPWVIRNKVHVGCATITTDARAFWKANNPDTYNVLAHGGWIDDVPNLPNAPPDPELAADRTLKGNLTTVDECAQMRFYHHLVDQKLRLAGQAVYMLWTPKSTVASENKGGGGLAHAARTTLEPVFMVLLYVLALAGLFFAPRRFSALALLLLAYNTVAAMAFAGAVRYRAPWDFLLALLAAFALAAVWNRLRRALGYSREPEPAR